MKAKPFILSLFFLLPISGVYLFLNRPKLLPSAGIAADTTSTTKGGAKKNAFMSEHDIYLAHSERAKLATTTSNSPTKLVKKKSDLVGSLIDKIDTDSLEKYQGTYTFSTLRDREADEPITLNSSWLIWNSKYPQVGTSIKKNSQSGEYEFVGASIFLPTKGIGVSYEKDKETDEIRAYLNFKKHF